MNLEEARNQAFERLKTERRKATPHDATLVAAAGLKYHVPPEIWRQLSYDLRAYPLYDALAMWLDEKGGLAAVVPGMMRAVADLFLKVAE